MANSTGKEAKRISRRCLTRVKVTTPTAPRTPLPTKFAVAEKHMGRFLSCEDYTGRRNLVILRQRSPRRKPRTPNEGPVHLAGTSDAVGEYRGPSARTNRGPQDDTAISVAPDSSRLETSPRFCKHSL